MEPGDIIFVISEKKHDLFKRNGNDLIMDYKINLLESLTGFSFIIKHLDDRELLIKTLPGEVIEPGINHCVTNTL